jgi:uncharacterized protein
VGSPADIALLIGAGALAGAVGTAGGITSLISYPALLATGLPALTANVTNIVAITACLPGAALSSRPELVDRGHWLRRWALVAACGGVLGSALLLSTPAGLFTDVVPYLLVMAAIGLLIQPRLTAWREHRRPGRDHLVLPIGLFAVSTYNGYFGAGAGVMTLALLLLTVDQHVARANALKNVLIGAATVASAATLIGFAKIDWSEAAPLAAGMFLGSTVGPKLARRVPAGVLRWLVAMTGLGLAARLSIAPL